MENQGYVIEVIFADGWKIAFQGKHFGPYPSEDAATATAGEWATNARKQGHPVTLVIRSQPGTPPHAGERRSPDGYAA
jgi:hypothetical protein